MGLFFFGILAVVWVYGYQRIDQPFVHDAMNYWGAGNSFVDNGRFSLLNYRSPLRGFLFPLLLSVIQWQARGIGVEPRVLFLTYSSLLFSVFGFYLLPSFFRSVFQWETPPIKRLLFSGLLFFFWRGHFLYPLTDFPSLAFLVSGIAILAGTGNNRERPLWVALAGFCLAAAVNIRPAYQASVGIVLVLLFFTWRRLGNKCIIIGFVSFIVGMGIVFLPQFIINRYHFGANSPFVLSTYIEDRSIYEVQLFWGLKTQKYETNIGDDYPSASVLYADPLAEKIAQRFLKDKTLKGYFNIVRAYPLDVAISYFRHSFNGLDIFFSTPYVKNIFANHFLLSFVNYVIWFLVLYYLVANPNNINTLSLSIVVVMLAPVVLAVPVVVEVRFFLPAYILAYGIVSYGLYYRELFLHTCNSKPRLFRMVLLLLGWVMICFTFSSSTIEQLQ